MFRPKAAFITGGALGIGKGLSEALLARGSKVIVGGRREAPLRAFAESHENTDWITIDVADPQSVARAARTLGERHSDLDCLINNAGLQKIIDFTGETQPDPATLREEIDINLVGLIQMSSAFLPLLRRHDAASIVQVTSGTAFIPFAFRPVYCATKAAVHSFTQSLRHQLKDSGVRVIELAPPLVYDTELHDGQFELPPHVKAMGLSTAEFIEQSLADLDRGEDEIAVAAAGYARQFARDDPAGAFAMLNGQGH